MIGHLLTIIIVLLVFSCLVTYHYIRDARRDLKNARENAKNAWRLYDHANRQLNAVTGKPAPSIPRPAPDAESLTPIVPLGEAGPSRILAREAVRRAQDAKQREPQFANIGVLTNRQPTAEEIASAAREAIDDGGRLN